MAVSAAATVMFATLVMAVVLAAFFVTVVFTAFVMAVMLAAASATSIFATAASASFAAHKVDHTLNLVVSCGTGSNNTAFEVKFLAGKRMVEVYYNFVFFYFKNKTLETVSSSFIRGITLPGKIFSLSKWPFGENIDLSSDRT